MPSKNFRQEIVLPKHNSHDLFRLIGIMHGDGNMSYNRILITDKSKKFHRTIHGFFRKLFNAKINLFKDVKRNSYYSHTKNRKLYEYFTEKLEIPKGAVRKQLYLPSFISNSSLNLRKSYIGGLFDAEGYVITRQAEIGISITNEEIWRFVSKVFDEINLKHSKNIRNRREANEFEIHVYGKDRLEKFQREISFSHQEKIKKLFNHVRFPCSTKYPCSPSSKHCTLNIGTSSRGIGAVGKPKSVLPGKYSRKAET